MSSAKIDTESIPGLENPAITCVINRIPEVVSILVEAGATVSSESSNMMTTIHFLPWPHQEGSIPHLVFVWWSNLYKMLQNINAKGSQICLTVCACFPRV